jgi:hypothetical protein
MKNTKTDRIHLLITLNEIRQTMLNFRKDLNEGKDCYSWLSDSGICSSEIYSLINEKHMLLGLEVADYLNMIDEGFTAHYEQRPFCSLDPKLQQQVRSLNDRIHEQTVRIIPWLYRVKPRLGMVSDSELVPAHIRIATWFDGVVDKNLFPRSLYIETDDCLLINQVEYQFIASKNQPKLVDIRDICTEDFKPTELIRVLMEYGGLGWDDLPHISIMTLNNLSERGWLDIYVD